LRQQLRSLEQMAREVPIARVTSSERWTHRDRSVRPAPAQSHTDCRARLILIVAPQASGLRPQASGQRHPVTARRAAQPRDRRGRANARDLPSPCYAGPTRL
jgi:hypothetical protein